MSEMGIFRQLTVEALAQLVGFCPLRNSIAAGPDPLHCLTAVGNKYLFDGSAKQRGNSKRERKAGIIPPGFYRVHRLAGDIEFIRKVGLRHIVLGSKDTETILHQYLRDR